MPEAAGPEIAGRWYGRVAYRVTRRIILVLGKVWWRLSVEGLENLPDGPFVISPVHRSYIDTPLMAVIPRRLRFMGKGEMWDSWFVGTVCSLHGGIPVDRGTADREAMTNVIDAVNEGTPVVLFPEGTRQDGPDLFPFFEGPAYVAARTGVPIVPVGIGGSARSLPRKAKFLYPTKIHIVVGSPLPPPPAKESGRISRKAVKETTERLAVVVQDLFDQAQSAVGQPNR